MRSLPSHLKAQIILTIFPPFLFFSQQHLTELLLFYRFSFPRAVSLVCCECLPLRHRWCFPHCCHVFVTLVAPTPAALEWKNGIFPLCSPTSVVLLPPKKRHFSKWRKNPLNIKRRRHEICKMMMMEFFLMQLKVFSYWWFSSPQMSDGEFFTFCIHLSTKNLKFYSHRFDFDTMRNFWTFFSHSSRSSLNLENSFSIF